MWWNLGICFPSLSCFKYLNVYLLYGVAMYPSNCTYIRIEHSWKQHFRELFWYGPSKIWTLWMRNHRCHSWIVLIHVLIWCGGVDFFFCLCIHKYHNQVSLVFRACTCYEAAVLTPGLLCNHTCHMKMKILGELWYDKNFDMIRKRSSW